MRVLLEAPILTRSGYGEHARLVHEALTQRPDLEVMINPLNWGQTGWDVPEGDVKVGVELFASYIAHCQANNENPAFDMQIHVGIPNEFEKKAPYSICITAGIESDRVDPSWLMKTHQGIDKIIVPSNHAKEGFIRTSYEVHNKTNDTKTIVDCACPVDVIGYPVKEIEAEEIDLELATDFNFLTVAMMGPRKNIETTISGFIKEFRKDKDVGLIIKTGLGRASVMDRFATKRTIEDIVNKCGDRNCKVYLIHGELSESQIHSLYLHPKVKAYVSTTHGEGYGLPIFEAAYSELPIIATGWSGHMDFLTGKLKGKEKKLFSKIDYELKTVQKEAVWKNIITEDSKWAYPRELDYMKKMRSLYKNYGMYKKWATVLNQTVRETNKKQDIVDKYLVSIFGETKKVQLNIDELKQQALEIQDVKARAKFAKEVLLNDISQTDKLSFLKDLFKGEKSYILSCGPTLTEHPQDKIKNLVSSALTVSIKQSFNLFEEETDFHIYNCANFKKYDYSNNSPVVIEASTSPYRLGECDLKFFIRERDFNKSVSATKDFDSWTFEKNPLLRPYGPGIMYEVVFYTMQHLGVSEIITIGWDNKLIEGTAAQQHFYDKQGSALQKKDFIDSNEVAENPAAVDTLETEGNVSTDAILPWCEWLQTQGTTMKIVSRLNPAPEQIERIEL